MNISLIDEPFSATRFCLNPAQLRHTLRRIGAERRIGNDVQHFGLPAATTMVNDRWMMGCDEWWLMMADDDRWCLMMGNDFKVIADGQLMRVKSKWNSSKVTQWAGQCKRMMVRIRSWWDLVGQIVARPAWRHPADRQFSKTAVGNTGYELHGDPQKIAFKNRRHQQMNT